MNDDDELIRKLHAPVVWSVEAGRMVCVDGKPRFHITRAENEDRLDHVSPAALDDFARRIVAAFNEQVAAASRCYLNKVRLNRGGYASDGTYYGTGWPLYELRNGDGDYVASYRAVDRADAKVQALADFPHITFR